MVLIDKVIPMKSGVRLSKINPKLTRLYPIIGGGHKNSHNFEGYHRALKEIVAVDREHTSIDFIRNKRKKKSNA